MARNSWQGMTLQILREAFPRWIHRPAGRACRNSSSPPHSQGSTPWQLFRGSPARVIEEQKSSKDKGRMRTKTNWCDARFSTNAPACPACSAAPQFGGIGGVVAAYPTGSYVPDPPHRREARGQTQFSIVRGHGFSSLSITATSVSNICYSYSTVHQVV